ncbi:MAG: class E sortase [Micromonosporaceae bacterium]|nr:class E sortase [Micromonosporaceae bacterium]
MLMVVAGLLLLSYAGLDWWWRVDRVAGAQASLDRVLASQWASASLAPATPTASLAQAASQATPQAAHGEPLARLHLPSLRLSLVVVEGVGEADLLLGPGHLPSTSQFGEGGNAGIAGHRYPGVFWDLDRVRPGSAAVVETGQIWLVYRIVTEKIVLPKDLSVLDPPPGGAPPMLTLITCHPPCSTARRLIRQGSLLRTFPKSHGTPKELGGDA